jgi:protein tyrosine phosphatase (PTP) superfamily phosphohydrolase (DUF442 family)
MRRVPRLLAYFAGGWLGLFLVVNLTILLVGVMARAASKDPRDHGKHWPSITNLREVDDKLLVGAQPSAEDYRELAERGVTLVIDVRSSGAADAHNRDDPELLDSLGVKYVSVSMTDGQAPSPGKIRTFLDLVDSNEGRVYAHCGGGVGRSTSIAAAYQASLGQDPSVLEQVATGPPTIEQIWYVGTIRPNHPEHEISPIIAVVSRFVDMPRTVWGWATSLL